MCALLSSSQSVTFHASDAPLQRKITNFPNRRRASGLVVKSQFPILGPRVRFPAGASLFFFVTFPLLPPSFNFFPFFSVICHRQNALQRLALQSLEQEGKKKSTNKHGTRNLKPCLHYVQRYRNLQKPSRPSETYRETHAQLPALLSESAPSAL